MKQSKLLLNELARILKRECMFLQFHLLSFEQICMALWILLHIKLSEQGRKETRGVVVPQSEVFVVIIHFKWNFCVTKQACIMMQSASDSKSGEEERSTLIGTISKLIFS